MNKLEYEALLKRLYTAKPTPVFISLPKLKYLAIDGEGDPNQEPFQKAVEALYGVAYTLKFLPKKGVPVPDYFDHKVAPLEGWWWSKSGRPFEVGNKADWLWTVAILQPAFMTKDLVKQAIELALTKKANPLISGVQLIETEAKEAAQILHIGPYADEAPTVDRLHEFIAQADRVLTGKHNEIYLGDPRRTKPEKLKTIIRHEVK